MHGNENVTPQIFSLKCWVTQEWNVLTHAKWQAIIYFHKLVLIYCTPDTANRAGNFMFSDDKWLWFWRHYYLSRNTSSSFHETSNHKSIKSHQLKSKYICVNMVRKGVRYSPKEASKLAIIILKDRTRKHKISQSKITPNHSLKISKLFRKNSIVLLPWVKTSSRDVVN